MSKQFDPKKMFTSTRYTFTLNPSDSFQYFGKVARYAKAIRAIQASLESLTYCEYELYPEVSKKGRIHFHGYIDIIEPARFQLYDVHILTKISIYEIDVLTDPDVWKAYIEKDKKEMLRFAKSIKQPYKISNKIIPQTPDILLALNPTGEKDD